MTKPLNKIDELLNKLCPEGVEFKQLGAVAKIKNGKDWKRLGKGKIPVYGTGGVMSYVDTFAYNKPTVLIPRKGSITNIFYLDEPFWNVDTIYYTEIDTIQIVPKFFYYVIKNIDLEKLDTGSGRPSLTQAILDNIQIPTPPLAIQQEILKILDTFTTLEAELEAELEARKKQYEYYREELLTFGEDVEWKTLGAVGEFVRGRRFVKNDIVAEGIPCIHYGEMYTHYKIWAKESKSYLKPALAARLRVAHPGNVVIVAAGETIEDIGNGVAWLGESDVVIHDACFAFNHCLNPKYVSYYLQTALFRTQIRRYISSGKISSIDASGLSKARIPIPPRAEQNRIVAILDKFDALVNDISVGLPAELSARRTQYEYYRGKLLTFEPLKKEYANQ